ncbi:hypothetical protein E2C01_053777 [Portunus trituberculatus]|uniref:Uncharacterized protein n=1 Tax=Portunus trituberculatus TaxID=210409 RepID=A0A5B7GQ41_PORTR|nr:hypothetical protein [Portunus trituberculatus]
MYDNVVRQHCHMTQGRIFPGGRGESQVTTQVQVELLLIWSPRWKDTLTLPRLTVCSTAKPRNSSSELKDTF